MTAHTPGPWRHDRAEGDSGEPATEQTLDDLVREQGFEGEAEFHRLVCEAPMDTPGRRERFLLWRNGDGTKAGLLALIAEANAAPEALAKVRLIETAPAMFAALERLEAYYEGGSEDDLLDVYDQARAALAKARGEAVKE